MGDDIALVITVCGDVSHLIRDIHAVFILLILGFFPFALLDSIERFHKATMVDEAEGLIHHFPESSCFRVEGFLLLWFLERAFGICSRYFRHDTGLWSHFCGGVLGFGSPTPNTSCWGCWSCLRHIRVYIFL